VLCFAQNPITTLNNRVLLSGTPTIATNGTFSLLANDAYGCSGTQQYTVAIFGAFEITAITREGNDIRVTWMMGSGKTNALQRTAGTGDSYNTNNFATIFTVTNTVGTTTNYLDLGAATNVPAVYYRIRLVL